MLTRLIDPSGAAATHPDSERLMPSPNPAIDRSDGIIRVMEPWLGEEEKSAVLAAFDSGIVSSASPIVKDFEAALAKTCGTKHAFAVTCGTHALDLVLHCLGVGPGDEVIVPACTFISVGATVARRGARPVYVDVDRTTLNMTAAGVEAAITDRTAGIIPVHTFGQTCDIDAIRAVADPRGLFLLEDACEALGASRGGRPVGGLGDAAVHGFYANKMITTGNGGAITTDSDELAELLADLRGYSYAPERLFWHHHWPFNLRISAMQAAMGTAQLGRLPEIVRRRADMARRYDERLRDVTGLVTPTLTDGGVCWMYNIHIEPAYGATAAEVRARLGARGVETRAVFAPLHAQPILQERSAPPQGPFPNAEWAAKTGINLPSNPLLTDRELDLICSVLRG